MRRNVAILGSTGSIGTQTLDVAREMQEHVRVVGLAAGTNVELLERQVVEFKPSAVWAARPVSGSLPPETRVVSGPEGMAEIAASPDVDLVVVATTGRAGLLPTLAALRAGKLVALANKESLVMAGSVVTEALRSGSGELVPIDSEHSAIWQCLQGETSRSIERLTLTASGGALRDLPADRLAQVTPEQALHHPTWSMGRKITVDSANLMNKGLEVIEACWLFDLPMDRIEVVMHAESIVHSLVTFDDSSTKAQMGLPNMRLPIQYAMSHPARWSNALPRLDLASVGELHFGPVDLARYPALEIALAAGRAGGNAPAALSAADEIAVEAFLAGNLGFIRIPAVVEAVMARLDHCSDPSLDDTIETDAWARSAAKALIARS